MPPVRCRNEECAPGSVEIFYMRIRICSCVALLCPCCAVLIFRGANQSLDENFCFHSASFKLRHLSSRVEKFLIALFNKAGDRHISWHAQPQGLVNDRWGAPT